MVSDTSSITEQPFHTMHSPFSFKSPPEISTSDIWAVGLCNLVPISFNKSSNYKFNYTNIHLSTTRACIPDYGYEWTSPFDEKEQLWDFSCIKEKKERHFFSKEATTESQKAAWVHEEEELFYEEVPIRRLKKENDDETAFEIFDDFEDVFDEIEDLLEGRKGWEVYFEDEDGDHDSSIGGSDSDTRNDNDCSSGLSSDLCYFEEVDGDGTDDADYDGSDSDSEDEDYYSSNQDDSVDLEFEEGDKEEKNEYQYISQDDSEISIGVKMTYDF